MPKVVEPDVATAKRERLAKRLVRMSNEDLIALAVQSIREREQIEAEFALMMEELGGRFPGKKATEEIITGKGVGERKESNSFAVPDASIPALRESLALDFSEYIEAKPVYSVPEDRITALRSHLGNDAPLFIKEVMQYRATKALSAKLDVVEDVESGFRIVPKKAEHEPLAAKVSPHIKGEKKITVKVKPVTN